MTSPTRSPRASPGRSTSGEARVRARRASGRSDHVVVVGSTRRRQQGGAIDATASQPAGAPAGRPTRRVARRRAPPPSRRAPRRVARKLPLSSRDEVLRALVAAGAELVIGGHVHQAGVAERREFKVPRGSASALPHPLHRLRARPPATERKEEARGLSVYDADGETITARTYSWDGFGAGFLQVGERVSPAGRVSPWMRPSRS